MSLGVLIELIGDFGIWESQSELDGRHGYTRSNRSQTGPPGKTVTLAVFSARRGRRRGPARGPKTARGVSRRLFDPVKPIAEVTDIPMSYRVPINLTGRYLDPDGRHAPIGIQSEPDGATRENGNSRRFFSAARAEARAGPRRKNGPAESLAGFLIPSNRSLK
jgi:hypothetical protein